jgi:hypothetical protein
MQVFCQRRLPHIWNVGQPVFLTWRLHGSLPPQRVFAAGEMSSGQVFAVLDRLLDEARSGPFYLRQPAIAEMVVDAIRYNAEVLGHYVPRAFVVMPNHVHLLLTPGVALPRLTKSLKGITQCSIGSHRSVVLAGGKLRPPGSEGTRVPENSSLYRTESGSCRFGPWGQPISLVQRLGDQGVACGPGGPPYIA